MPSPCAAHPPAVPLRLPFGWAALLTLLLVACSGRTERRDSLARPLRLLDQSLDRASTIEELDKAVEGHLALLGRARSDRRVNAGLARALSLRGFVQGSAGESDLVSARQAGLRCLRQNPAFAALVDVEGGRITPRAAATVDPLEAPCLLWTVDAWARWLHTHGAAGAAIDLGPVEALAGRLQVIASAGQRVEAQHAIGLALSARPQALGNDLATAQAAFAQAAAADPKRLLFQLDLALLAELPRGEGASGRGRLERIAQATAATAEEREVQRRAQAALAR